MFAEVLADAVSDAVPDAEPAADDPSPFARSVAASAAPESPSAVSPAPDSPSPDAPRAPPARFLAASAANSGDDDAKSPTVTSRAPEEPPAQPNDAHTATMAAIPAGAAMARGENFARIMADADIGGIVPTARTVGSVSAILAP